MAEWGEDREYSESEIERWCDEMGLKSGDDKSNVVVVRRKDQRGGGESEWGGSGGGEI